MILKDHHDLTKHLNTIVFHTKMVDYLDELLVEVGDIYLLVSSYTAGLILKDHHNLPKHLNTIVFHTKMVDYLDELLVEVGDLSIYW